MKAKDFAVVNVTGGRPPDRVRMNKSMVVIVKEAADIRKVVGAI